MKNILLYALILLAGVSQAALTTYTWTGGAGDGDWNNASNWDSNGIPEDKNTDPGITFDHIESSIVFSTNSLPTSNIPEWGGTGGDSGNSPAIMFTQGGTLSLDVGKGRYRGIVSRNAGYITNRVIRTIFTLGDGVGDNDTILNTTFNRDSGFSRDGKNIITQYFINSDATWNASTIGKTYLYWANPDQEPEVDIRWTQFTIAGGTVNFSFQLDQISKDIGEANNHVLFTDGGGSFTAKFGKALPDLASVTNNFGSFFKAGTDITLAAADNGDGSFTVSSSGGGVTLPATIISVTPVSGNLLKLVISAPSAADKYYPKAKSALTESDWVEVPHSDNGTNPFKVSNLTYSTVEGENKVIYVKTTDTAKFFGIGEL